MRNFFWLSLSVFFFSSYTLLQAELQEQRTVFVYEGPGVSHQSLKQIDLAVKKALPDYFLTHIGPSEVINDPWEEKAAFFILPGGADIPYAKALNGRGNQKIKDYVVNGGAFLGICAGSYYAGGFVDFAKDTPLEVQGPRELAFFPGTVKGPALAEYDYLSNKGARAAQLTWSAPSTEFKKDQKFTVFYNGGGFFLEAADFPNTSILAYYDDGKGKRPGIIQCQVGKGMAILSGAHFEYDPALLDAEDPYLKNIIPLIVEGNQYRELLLKELFVRLLSKDL
jgi:biotin--protein ligase